MILEGRIKVNGKTVREMGQTVDPEIDKIEVDERPVSMAKKMDYLLLYKPVGYVTTMKDEFGRSTVKDLIKAAGVRVFPVGRLDMDTSGLLLLTNDGELANRLTHPAYGVEKEYLAKIHDTPTAATLTTLESGVKLDDGMTAPAKVRLVKGGRPTSVVSLTIKEGRNRQVRRMLEAVGHPIVSLKRTSFGSLTLAGLEESQWRHLSISEIAELKRVTGLK